MHKNAIWGSMQCNYGATAARCNFQSRSLQKDVEGINSSTVVVSKYRAIAQRLLAPLSFFNPTGRSPTTLAKPNGSRKAFRPSRLTDFQKQLSSFWEFWDGYNFARCFTFHKYKTDRKEKKYSVIGCTLLPSHFRAVFLKFNIIAIQT